MGPTARSLANLKDLGYEAKELKILPAMGYALKRQPPSVSRVLRL